MIEVKAKEIDTNAELYEKLIEDFNKLSKEMKTKFSLVKETFPRLSQSIFLGMGERLGMNTIFYDINNNRFYFYGGINEELFEQVKPILEQLKQDFLIELV